MLSILMWFMLLAATTAVEQQSSSQSSSSLSSASSTPPNDAAATSAAILTTTPHGDVEPAWNWDWWKDIGTSDNNDDDASNTATSSVSDEGQRRCTTDFFCYIKVKGLKFWTFITPIVYCYTVHLQYDRLLASSCLRLSVCNAVHCGSQGRFTGLKVVPASS